MSYEKGQKLVCISNAGWSVGTGPCYDEVVTFIRYYDNIFIILGEYSEKHCYISNRFIPLEDWNQNETEVAEIIKELQEQVYNTIYDPPYGIDKRSDAQKEQHRRAAGL